jgi:hypothetical protein
MRKPHNPLSGKFTPNWTTTKAPLNACGKVWDGALQVAFVEASLDYGGDGDGNKLLAV